MQIVQGLQKGFLQQQLLKVTKTLRSRKEKYVQQKLEIYDQQVKGIEEKSKWGGHLYNCY